jgi:hypothetical protein
LWSSDDPDPLLLLLLLPPSQVNDDARRIHTFLYPPVLAQVACTLPVPHVHNRHVCGDPTARQSVYRSTGALIPAVYTCLIRPAFTPVLRAGGITMIMYKRWCATGIKLERRSSIAAEQTFMLIYIFRLFELIYN